MLPNPRGMHGPACNWFVKVDIAVTNLDIESAVGIAAHPCLVVNRRALASEVGKGQQFAISTLAAFRPSTLLHWSLLLFHHPGVKAPQVYHPRVGFAKPYSLELLREPP